MNVPLDVIQTEPSRCSGLDVVGGGVLFLWFLFPLQTWGAAGVTLT